jgi:hypothetical protein
MNVDFDVLENAGHPPRRTAALVAAWSDRGDEPLFAPIKEVRDIRDHCLGCLAGVAREVRECGIRERSMLRATATGDVPARGFEVGRTHRCLLVARAVNF